MEAARQVLKRAAELKILNSDQIISLSAAVAEDLSGSIQNGSQIACMCHMQPISVIFTV